MKVELQPTDTIVIPRGYRIAIKDDNITFEKDPEIKDGDIVTYEKFLKNSNCIFIYKDTDEEDGSNLFYVGLNTKGNLVYPRKGTERFSCGALRLANENEINYLFSKLEAEGLRWNPKEKRLEKIR